MKNKKIILYVIFAIYVAFSIYKMCYHEPWRDEAQAWLLARDAGITELIDGIKRDGHPLLWTLCLKVLTLLQLPYSSMQMFHLLINFAVVYLILFKAPFKISLRLLIIFSDIISYEYLVKSRNYILPVLLIILLAMLYKDRLKKPIQYCVLLVLLLNTVIYYLGFVSILAVLYIYEIITKFRKGEIGINYKLCVISIATVIISIILLMLMVYNPNIDEKFIVIDIPNSINSYVTLVFTMLYTYGYAFFTAVNINSVVTLIIGIIAIMIAIKTFKKEKIIIYVCSTGFTLLFSSMVYSSGTRHLYINIILYIFCLWIMQINTINDKKNLQLVHYFCCAMLVFSLVISIYHTSMDIEYKFSDSSSVANYINKNYREYTIVTYYSSVCSSIIPYLENKFWSVEDENYYTYIPWTKNYNLERKGFKLEYNEVISRINKKFSDKSKIIVIFSKKLLDNQFINEQQLSDIENVYYTTDAVISDEEYSIFKFK